MLLHTFINDVIENYGSNHRKQVNNSTKILFYGLSYDELHVTIDLCWSNYNDFNHNNGPCDEKKRIWINKDIHDGNSNLWHHNYLIPCTKRFSVL